MKETKNESNYLISTPNSIKENDLQNAVRIIITFNHMKTNLRIWAFHIHFHRINFRIHIRTIINSDTDEGNELQTKQTATYEREMRRV